MGVDVRVCPFEADVALVFLLDAIVGVMKLALALFSDWEETLFCVGMGEAPLRRFLLPAFEVISIKVPISEEIDVVYFREDSFYTNRKL